MKNLKLLLIILMIGVVVFCLCACQNTNPDDGLLEGELVISENKAEITMGDVYSLRVMIGNEILSCSWSSSDESIATVVGNGKVHAYNLGEATITATYGSRTVTCKVTVGLNDNLPVLQLNCSDDGNVQIDDKHSIYLDGKVHFNGNEYTDVTYSYQLSDQTLGKIEDGVFTPSKVGEGQITVTAEWRGIQSHLLTQTLNVKIVKSVSLLVNGDPNLGDVNLYSIASFDGKTYQNTVDFDATAVIDGQSHAVEIAIDNENVISFDATAKKLVAQGMGSATVTLKYVQGDIDISKTVKVNVDAPVTKYENVVTMFSAMDGDLIDSLGNDLLTQLFGDHNPLNSAYQLDAQLDVSTGKILGVQTSGKELTKTTITVYGQKYGYIIDLEGYTKVINDYEDLCDLRISTPNTVLNGYFYLNADVTIPEALRKTYFVNETSWDNIYSSSYFAGTFDGNGKTIDGFPVRSGYSLFGRVEGATIKNVALTNVQIMDASTRVFACMSGMNVATYYINVYVSITQGSNEAELDKRLGQYAIFGDQHSANLKLENVVIYQPIASTVTYTHSDPKTTQGVGFFSRDLSSASRPSMNSVYFVTPLGENRVVPIYQSLRQTVYAGNKFTDIDDGTKVSIDQNGNPYVDPNGTHLFYRYNGVSQYESFEQMVEAGTKVVGGWDISNGAPVWVGNN